VNAITRTIAVCTGPRYSRFKYFLGNSATAMVVAIATVAVAGCGGGSGSSSSTTGTATTTAVTASSTNFTVGTSITLTAIVSPSAATGTITFSSGSSTLGTGALSSGTATLTTSALTAGTDSVTAAYSGDTTYASSTSSAITITVNAVSSSTTPSSCGLGTAEYVLTTGTATQSSLSYSATGTDESAICVENSGTTLTVTSPTISTTGNTSSIDNSSFYGQDAAVLAYGSSATSNSGGSITVTGGTIGTTGIGANGAFASGLGSSVTLQGVTITASGGDAHAVDAAYGGVLTLTNVTATTSGASSPTVATDRGGGTVTVSGGSFTANGAKSASVYSTGTISITGGRLAATDAEALVVEGASSATLTNCTLSGAVGNDDRGIFLYNSGSGAALTGTGYFTMTGGTYTWPSTAGPAFYVTNQTGVIKLSGVTVNNSSSTLLEAEANSNWGTTGQNGGVVTFSASNEALVGSVVADNISTIAVSLSNGSSLNGAINSSNAAKSVALTLDSTSTWTVTGTSYLTTLNDSGGISGSAVTNIIGNGNNVYYLSADNPSLAGATYTLSGGGSLIPQ
jgi:hypothetical protein